ncbi:MAG: hypothetical protein PWP07_2561 [Epulopiscium sp.]|jgi:hypothetical protein|nr:hypothetical protein [Candidatus Epulonipiscium sp.]
MVQSVLNLIANTAKLTSTSAYSLFPTKKTPSGRKLTESALYNYIQV